MSLLGLAAWQTLALGGAGAAVIVLLYLRQWGRRRITVAFAPLWDKVLSASELGTARRRLVDVASLLLQLVILATLLGALAQPLLGRAPGATALVIDTSSSMLANRPPRGDRFGEARRRAIAVLNRLSKEERVALVVTGGAARVMVAPTHDHLLVRRKLEELSACACEGRLAQAVTLARGALAKGGKLRVFTDGNDPLPAADEQVSIELVGRPVSNVAVTTLGVSALPSAPGRLQGLVEVTSFADHPARGQLRISIDGRLVEVSRFELKTGERHRRVLPELRAGEGEGILAAELVDVRVQDDVDAFAEDDRAYALLRPTIRRPVRLIAPEKGASFVRTALQANDRYQLIQGSEASGGRGEVTVVVGRAAPPEPGRYLVLGAPPEQGKAKLGEAVFTDWRIDHPVLRNVSLDSVVLRGAFAAPESSAIQMLGRFGEATLLFARTEGERREVVATFDPEQSNLPLRVAFPVLLYNAIDWLAEDGEEETSYLPGRRWRFPQGKKEEEAARVEGPGTLRVFTEGGEVLVEGAARAGIYRVHTGGETYRVVASVTSATESELRREAVAPPAGASDRSMELWSWLAAAALALVLLEWQLYHRRVTA